MISIVLFGILGLYRIGVSPRKSELLFLFSGFRVRKVVLVKALGMLCHSLVRKNKTEVNRIVHPPIMRNLLSEELGELL